jgi:predicted RND superfamily exporter protein
VTESENRFFRKYAELVIKGRWFVILAMLVACGAAVMTIKSGLYVDNSPEAFSDSSSDVSRNLELFRDIFGRDDVTLILVEGDVFSPGYLDRLNKLHAEIAAINIDLETLGQRRSYTGGTRQGADGGRKKAAPAKPAETQQVDPDDEFADTDFGDEEFEDDDFGGEDDAWGDEEGGSVIEEVTSLINVRKIRAVTDGIQVGDLLDPMPETEAELAAVRADVLGDPSQQKPADATLVGQVVSADGRFSAVVVRAAFMGQNDSVKLSRHLAEIADKYNADDFKVHLAGLPTLNATFEEIILKDMQTLTGLMLLIIFVMLTFMFHNPLGAIAPILVVIVSAIWALGFMAGTGTAVTGITNILPAFLICVGIADSVHLMSVYRQRMLDGLDSKEAVIMAVADTGIPVLFTSFTTAVGLLSFMFASVDAIGDMGMTGAFGVFAAFFNTVTLLPVILSFNKKSLLGADKPGRMGAIDAFLRICAGASGEGDRGRRLTLLVSGVLSVVALFGATTLYVWHDPLTWIPDDQPIKQAFAATDKHLGGTANVHLLFKATGEHGVKDARLQKGMVDLAAHIREYEHPVLKEKIVGNARGVADILKEINMALHGGTPDQYFVPEAQDRVDNYFLLVENSGPDDLRRLMTLDAQMTQMTIGVKWQEATSYIPLSKHIEEGVKKHIPSDVAEVATTGAVYNLLSTVGLLILDMVRTFGIAFAFITVIMVFLLKNLKLGMIAMAPNLLPIVFILGLMGYADIPIDMMNLMIASIALGIAVDDTIHLLHHYRMHYDQHGKVEEAIQHSLKHTGRALVVTSVILSSGFFVYLYSIISGISRFGMLIGLTVIFAVVLDLTMTPALLRTFFKDKA